MHTFLLSSRLGRWLAVLLLLVSSTAAQAQLVTENFNGTWTTPATLTTTGTTGTWGDGGATGDQQWHRNDFTTGWTSTSGSPGATGVGGTGNYARFHTYDAATGATGSLISPTLDLSGTPGTKALQFAMINTSGTDVVNVFLSTDGGTTYGTTLGQFGVYSAFTTLTINLGTVTSSTAKIKFTATSDFGTTDIGLDNFQIFSTTAICGTKSVGPTGDYASLTAALNAVNLNGTCGPLVLELQSSYVSTGETFPLAYTYTGGSSSNTVTVRPAAGATGLSITGSSTSSILNMSGGKYFILDGRPGGSGSPVSGAAATTDLLVANTSTSGTTLNLAGDATNNVVQHCQLKGVGTSTSFPIVNFSATAATGNSNNTVQNNALSSGATSAAIFIYSGSSLNASNTISNNTLADFYSATAASYGIFLSSAGNGWTISSNSFYQTASRTPVAFTHYGISVASGGGHAISGNAIGGSAPATFSGSGPATLSGTWTASATAAAYRFVGINLNGSTTASTVTNNTIGNVAWYSSSGATTAPGVWAGIYLLSNATVQGNSVGNSVAVTTTTSGGISYGIVSSTGPTTLNVSGNTVAGLTATGSTGTIAGSVAGIQTAGTTNNVFQNKIYGLVAANAGVSTGIIAFAGTTTAIYNNLIGSLSSPASTSLLGVAGLTVTAGTTVNAYYNSIYLNASSTGATFGTSGIYLNSTTTTLDARNNLVVNNSTAVGTGGYTAAFRRVSGTAGTVPTNYAATSNTNLLYAGTPSATSLIYVEGTTTATNAQQTIGAYRAFMANRDQNSVTENVSFVSTTGTDATFLHLSSTVPTQAESGGMAVSGIGTDFDGDTRNAATPDIGADEGTFLLSDQTPPIITYAPLSNTGSSSSRTLVVTITDASGLATGTGAPRIYYRSGTSAAFFGAVATAVAGNSYTFTIDYANIGGAPASGTTIQYYVAAQDASPGSNVGTNPAGGTGTNPPGSTAPATFSAYQILTALSGTYYVTTTVGSSPNPAKEFATLTAAVTAYNTNGLSGAVNFVLLDASYGTGETFPLALNSNSDASATNTLTIKPGTGVTTTIAGSVATGAVLKLNGADYVTIDGSNAGTTSRDLTIANTSATGSGNAVVWLAAATATDGASFNTLKNSNITGNSGAGFPQFTVFLGGGGTGVTAPTTSTPAANSNNTFTNNVITKGYYGVFVFGVSAAVLDQNNTFTGNQLGQTASGTGFGQEGLRVVYQQGLNVTGNDIQNVTNGTTTSNLYGIFLADSKNSVISRNSVHGISYTGTGTTKVWAINTSIAAFTTAANASANRFDNNLVYGINSTAISSTWNTVGIDLGGGYGEQVVYNSVYLSGQLSAASGTAGSAAFANGNPSNATAATNIDVRDNIFSIIGGTGGTTATPLYAHYEYGSTVAGSTLNYNDLYVTVGATGAAVIGHLGSGDYVTLPLWRTATGQEANSVSVDPQFTQTAVVPYDLTPTATGLNGAATSIVGVAVDYTGAARGTTPDIGAYEFTPPACQAVSGLAFTGITSTSANVTFSVPTGGAGANSYTVAYTPAGGTATTVTPNPTGSPVALSGLTANTVYTLTVTTNCTGATSPSATGTFRTACLPPTYATLPASEGFESTWLSRCDTREVPTASWLNTPTTGENSWRREDDGTAANWTLPNGGAFTPAGQNSAHSARFHAYYAPSGNVGTLDFYVDLSSAGTKRLSFGYVNQSTGGSKMDVLLSTDGGATFATTPLLSITTSAAFSNRTVDLTATSATSVIRFRATSDFGSYDIGLDNVLVRVLPAIDLAATALTTPTATQGCYASAEIVTVTVSNQGEQAIDFGVNPGTVTAVVTTPSGPQTLTASLATGTLAAGATQSVTLAPTLDMTAVGTYTFAIAATAVGDGNAANDALTPAPTRTVVAPVAGTLSPASNSLCVSGTAALTLTGAANGSIQYQSSPDNVTFTDIAGATSAAYTTPVLTSTTYYRAQVRCGTAVATSNVSTITVNNPLVAGTNTPLSICSGSTATLTATASAGSSVRFFDVATGGTALTTTTAGSYTTPALTASTTYYAEAFTSSTSVAGLTSNAATNGTFSQATLTDYPLGFAVAQAGTLASVDVYPSATGTLTITLYRTTGGQPAGTTTAVAGSDVTITVTAAQVGTRVTVPLNYALAAGDYRISNSTGTLGRFSTYTGTYPLTSGPLTVKGSYTAFTSTSFSNTTYNSFFNLTFTSDCASATRTAIQVNVTAPATASFATATGSSCGTSAVALTGAVGGSATGGTYTSSGTGTFSPDANTLTATYTPSAADVAAGTVTITLTSSGSTPCPAATATFALSISPAPVAAFSYPAATTYCAGSTSTVSPTLGSGATAGTFSSTTGLTIDPATGVITLSSSTAGTYTVTNSVAASGACAAVSATTTVVITPATTATFSYSGGTFCVSGTNPTATVTGTTGGTFSSTTGLTIDATTGAITLSSTTPGTYTVTYTVAGACGSSSTQLVTITTAPVATFSYGTPSTYCVSGTTSPAPSFGTGASGGVFSSTTGLTINASTGVITLSSSTPGTYTVTNTIAANGGCAAATATAQVTITAAPTAAFSYASASACAGSATLLTPTLGTGATAGTFTSTTGLTINATTGAVNPATSTAGTYTVTNTVAASGGCAAATSTATVTINALPATPTYTYTYPTRSTVLFTSSVAPAGTTYQWYLNGGIITGATSQTYTANGTTSPGSYTVRFISTATGCQSAASVVLVVTATNQALAGSSLRLFPNPTPSGQVTLELTGYRSATQLTVLDALGRVVTQQLLPANAGTATHALDLTGAATGVYLLRLSNADGVETHRLVRE